jgi:hypothetical protein
MAHSDIYMDMEKPCVYIVFLLTKQMAAFYLRKWLCSLSDQST